MAKQSKQNRRDFLKISAAGAAAFSMGGLLTKNAEAATGLVWPDTGTMAINPAIENLRVVACNDPAMITGTTTGTFQSFNNAVNTATLQTNMDKMAMALAQKGDAKSAWATIFRKPAGKTWSQVKVAIKVNCIDSSDMPRLAIIDKICKALNSIGETTTDPGVPYANMTIYDCTQSRVTTTYASTYAKPKLPDGILVNQALGVNATYALPKGNATLYAGDLNNGNVDILVNIALNKGHDQFDKGKTTLCLKNHYGTFQPQPGSYPRPNGCGDLDYLVHINKSTPILGGTPPRQQLCIIDSLWAMKQGPTGGEIVQNNRIVMGVFAGAVDYLVARKIRQDIMNIPLGATNNNTTYVMNSAAINRYLTDFGYVLTAPAVANLDFVDALTWVPPTGVKADAAADPDGFTTRISVSHAAGKSSGADFELPASASEINISFIDARGQTVRTLKSRPSALKGATVLWDGKSRTGQTVPPGLYAIRVAGEGWVRTGSIIIGN